MQKVAKQRTQVKELPDCDLCGNTAKYDAPTVNGPGPTCVKNA